MLLVLQTHNAGIVHGDSLYIFGALKQALRLEFFTTEANHHDFAAEVRVQRNIVDCANRDHCRRRVNCHPATVQVIQTDHAVHVRVAWE